MPPKRFTYRPLVSPGTADGATSGAAATPSSVPAERMIYGDGSGFDEYDAGTRRRQSRPFAALGRWLEWARDVAHAAMEASPDWFPVGVMRNVRLLSHSAVGILVYLLLSGCRVLPVH